MDLQPFLLDEWLSAHDFATPPIRYNLAASTGPPWTLGHLKALGDEDSKKALETMRVAYSPAAGTKALRQRIADFHNADPEWVAVTTGASEALLALFCVVAEPGGSIVLPAPVFPAMPVMARAWGMSVKPYTLSRDNGFEQTAAQVLAVVDATTRLVLVNTPHSPTGSVMAVAELTKLAEALAARGIPLAVDEVYHPLYFNEPRPSAAVLPNTIVLNDMSKALSLPGLRTGWLIDRDAKRRKRLINARSYFTISSSPILEALATTALTARGAILSRLDSVARANLALLDGLMHEHRSVLQWVRPVGGTVSFPWFVDGRDSRPFCEALAKAGVLVAPGDCFEAPAHFRLGFGGQESRFQDPLTIFSRVLAAQ
ncbi:MAG: pyridoxal phosphate-dependent aminotransferase [Gammaproteobacteria bacterium]